MNSRAQIMQRLKSASWAERRIPAPVFKAGEPQKGDVELFITRAQAAGAQIERASDLEAARAQVLTIIEEQKINQVIGANDEATNGMKMHELAGEKGFSYHSSAELQGKAYREYVTKAQLGISGCSCGVAETGTLLLTHDHNNERLVSHAPNHYVGIVFAEQILDDRFSLTSRLRRDEKPPAAWTLVTGVSRTADVGLQVILGMHGPRQVTIIIIG